MIFFNHLFAEYRRKQALKRQAKSSALKSYLSHSLPKGNEFIKELEFLVLDFETTGLNAMNDQIISMGYTVIKNLHVMPTTSTHILINPNKQLTEDNVSIHQLTDDELKEGVSLSHAMNVLLAEMTDRVVVVHFDAIEKGFINQACRALYQMRSLPMIMIDTLKIEQLKIRQTHGTIKPDGLRLYALREKYHLPRYKAHNAMQDAIATAELFLAQIDYTGSVNSLKLKDLI